MKIRVETDTMSTEEALALVIFLIELRNLPRDYSLATTKASASAVVASGDESSGAVGGSDSAETVAGSADPARAAEGQRRGGGRKKVARETAVFVLRNETTGVEVTCDTARPGDVDLARGYLETWIRDAATAEAIESLAKMGEPFVAACLTGKEQRALARIVAESLGAFAEGATAETPAVEDDKPAASGATEEAMKEAGKALAAKHGLAAVTTVLAKFDVKSFRDVKPEKYGEVVAMLTEALN